MTTKTPYPSETQERYIVRFPDGMRDRIREAAEASGRSMNAEIVARLQASFEQGRDRQQDVAELSDKMARLLDAFDELKSSLGKE